MLVSNMIISLSLLVSLSIVNLVTAVTDFDFSQFSTAELLRLQKFEKLATSTAPPTLEEINLLINFVPLNKTFFNHPALSEIYDVSFLYQRPLLTTCSDIQVLYNKLDSIRFPTQRCLSACQTNAPAANAICSCDHLRFLHEQYAIMKCSFRDNFLVSYVKSFASSSVASATDLRTLRLATQKLSLDTKFDIEYDIFSANYLDLIFDSLFCIVVLIHFFVLMKRDLKASSDIDARSLQSFLVIFILVLLFVTRCLFYQRDITFINVVCMVTYISVVSIASISSAPRDSNSSLYLASVIVPTLTMLVFILSFTFFTFYPTIVVSINVTLYIVVSFTLFFYTKHDKDYASVFQISYVLLTCAFIQQFQRIALQLGSVDSPLIHIVNFFLGHHSSAYGTNIFHRHGHFWFCLHQLIFPNVVITYGPCLILSFFSIITSLLLPGLFFFYQLTLHTHEHRSFSMKVLTSYVWFFTEIGAAPRRIIEFLFVAFSTSHDRIRSPSFSLLTNLIYFIYWAEFTLPHLCVYTCFLILYCLYDPVPDVKLYKHTFAYDCETTPVIAFPVVSDILSRTGQITFTDGSSGSFFFNGPRSLLSVGHLFSSAVNTFKLSCPRFKSSVPISDFDVKKLNTASSPDSQIEDSSVTVTTNISLPFEDGLTKYKTAPPTALDTFTHLFCVAKAGYIAITDKFTLLSSGFISANLPISPGYSGTPVFGTNSKDRSTQPTLIGVISAGTKDSLTSNLVVPLSNVLPTRFTSQLSSDQSSSAALTLQSKQLSILRTQHDLDQHDLNLSSKKVNFDTSRLQHDKLLHEASRRLKLDRDQDMSRTLDLNDKFQRNKQQTLINNFASVLRHTSAVINNAHRLNAQQAISETARLLSFSLSADSPLRAHVDNVATLIVNSYPTSSNFSSAFTQEPVTNFFHSLGLSRKDFISILPTLSKRRD